VIVLCGCLISLTTFGVRSVFGLFTVPLSTAHGWDREIFSFAIALQNLMWGVGQPIAGAIADRFGSARVLVVGILLYGVGLVVMAGASTPLSMQLGGGVLVGLGVAGSSFGIMMAAVARLLPEEKRSWAYGVVTAAASLGQFLFAPLGRAFISNYGWATALLLLALCVSVAMIFILPLRGRGETQTSTEPQLSLGQALRLASADSSYRFLVVGFFVCGFQLAFIGTHLPPYLTDQGISVETAAWVLGLIGLSNVVGCYYSGVLGALFPKRYLLSALYLSRAAAITIFMLVPLSPSSAFLFAFVLGFLWLSTVPLTNGLVVSRFGTRYMATLFGVVFMSHQIGSFSGVWLGGIAFDRTGSYDAIWWASVALGVFAALMHMPIREQLAKGFENAAA